MRLLALSASTCVLLSSCFSSQREGGATGASTTGSSCPSGEIVVNGACEQSENACAQGAVWVGDVCVTQNCAADSYLPCMMVDGGLGICTAGTCLNLATDPNNCGSYGFVCPSLTTCLSGTCRFTDGGTPGCEAPYVAEFYECVLSACSDASDNQPCLDAGVDYPGFCCHGVCQISDPQSCGGCGVTCAAGSVCEDGCYPGAECLEATFGDPCEPSDGGIGMCCGESCVDIASDAANCDECGIACPLGAACVGATCTATCASSSDCPEGFGCSTGAGQPAGSCLTTVCTSQMTGDQCLADADGGLGTCCGGQCVPESRICDGKCAVCGLGEVCLNSTCLEFSDCAAGARPFDAPPCLTDAGAMGACCGSQCIDVATDALNCGQCGLACPAGGTCETTCLGGVCDPGEYSSSCVDDNHNALSCGLDSPCSAGYSCGENGFCMSDVCDGTNAYCAIDGGVGICCADQCVIPSGDGGECTRCGSYCPPGAVCNGSGCVLPDGGSACGAPGFVCPAGTVCTDVGECDPILDCSPSDVSQENTCIFGEHGDGVCCGDSCSDVTQDPKNCGTCGNVCASGICAYYQIGSVCLPVGPTDDCAVSCGPGTSCVNGRCAGSACQIDAFPFCIADNGTVGMCCVGSLGTPWSCAHLLDDPQNCGICGDTCPAGQTCSGGTCSGAPSCGPGHMFEYCDLDAGPAFLCCLGSGCTNTFTDPANCGSCGNACSSGSNCLSGICQ